MEEHGDVIFGGDGYSPEWHRAAVEERGLRNIPTTADALPALIDPEVIDLFERMDVLSAGRAREPLRGLRRAVHPRPSPSRRT